MNRHAVIRRGRHRSLLMLLPLAWLSLSVTSARAESKTGELKAQVLDEQKAPIEGALCNLSGPSLPAQALQIVSGQNGGVQFPGLLWGKYVLTCAAAG